MLFRLIILFTVVPLVELALLSWLSDQIGMPMTILLVLATGFVGATLARRQGWQTLERIRRQLSAGRPVAADWIDGLMILLAGALLITPGILTDGVGFVLLLPPARAMLKWWLSRVVQVKWQVDIRGESVGTSASSFGNGQSAVDEETVIDVEYSHRENESR